MKWYEQYSGGARLPMEVCCFLDRYTEEDFNHDFLTIFPNVVFAQKVTILYAAALMMNLAKEEEQ